MLTIIYNKKRIRINIKYLYLIILKALAVEFAVVGAFVLLGAVGSHELFRIGVTDFLILLLQAVLLFGIAYDINCFMRRFYRE